MSQTTIGRWELSIDDFEKNLIGMVSIVEESGCLRDLSGIHNFVWKVCFQHWEGNHSIKTIMDSIMASTNIHPAYRSALEEVYNICANRIDPNIFDNLEIVSQFVFLEENWYLENLKLIGFVFFSLNISWNEGYGGVNFERYILRHLSYVHLWGKR